MHVLKLAIGKCFQACAEYSLSFTPVVSGKTHISPVPSLLLSSPLREAGWRTQNSGVIPQLLTPAPLKHTFNKAGSAEFGWAQSDAW